MIHCYFGVFVVVKLVIDGSHVNARICMLLALDSRKLSSILNC